MAFEVWDELANADETIHFGMDFWTDDVLADRAVERLGAGVEVYGVWDLLGASSTSSADERLCAAGAQIKTENFSGKVHHKFAVLDVEGTDPVVVLGSYNWTDQGAYDNDENTLIIHDRELAQAYYAEWQRLWSALGDETLCAPPTLAGLPDQLFTETTSQTSTIDLWDYAWDTQTPTDVLTYTIEGTPPAGAGVTLADNRTVTVDPSPNWCGGTDVTVRATDPGGLWGEDTFRVAVSWSCLGPVEMPGAPVLVAPVDGRAVHSGRPTFAWHVVGGAEAYQIQVDGEADEGHPADFSSPERDETIVGMEYIPATGLSGGTYTWRVRAINGSEIGAWSERWAFTALAPSPAGLKIYLPAVERCYSLNADERTI